MTLTDEARRWLRARREALLRGEPRAAWEHPPPELAAEVARIRGGEASDRPTLASTCREIRIDPIAVREYAQDSARVWAEGHRLTLDEAEADLRRYLPEARRVEGDTQTPERWRYRRKSTGIDLTARVARVGDVAVVRSITARAY